MKLYLVDGSAYIFRAFYGVPLLETSTGIPTNAVFGFARSLINLLVTHNPEYIVVAMDGSRRTFRNDLLPTYKGNRKARPGTLSAQLPYCNDLVSAFNIPCLAMMNFEADDIIATLSDRWEGEVVVVSGDKDLMQLVSDGRVQMFDLANSQWINEQNVIDKFGVGPDHLRELFALTGDASDNIPGVKGIGKQTAATLIREYGSLENISANLYALSDKVRRCVKGQYEMALLSRDLVSLRRDLPVDASPDLFRRREFDRQALRDLFTELEFFNLLKTIEKWEV